MKALSSRSFLQRDHCRQSAIRWQGLEKTLDRRSDCTREKSFIPSEYPMNTQLSPLITRSRTPVKPRFGTHPKGLRDSLSRHKVLGKTLMEGARNHIYRHGYEIAFIARVGAPHVHAGPTQPIQPSQGRPWLRTSCPIRKTQLRLKSQRRHPLLQRSPIFCQPSHGCVSRRHRVQAQRPCKHQARASATHSSRTF